MTFSAERIQIQGLDVVRSGQRGAPLLLLLRMAANTELWGGVWPGLAAEFDVAQVRLRTPSHSELDAPAEMFRRLSAQCAAVASELGHEQFHVFGWNGGTHVALRCAIDFPGRVRSCVLLGPFWPLEDMRRIDAGLEIMRVMMEQPDRVLYATYWFMGGLSPKFVSERFDDVLRWAHARAAGDPFLQGASVGAMKWAKVLRGQWTVAQELDALAVRTLIIAHGLDPWNAGPTVEMAAALHRKLPASRLEVLEGCGSLVPLEDPERLLGVLLPFLKEYR